MSDDVECRACDIAKLPLVWCVQSRRMVHLRGLGTFACKRVEARERRKAANERARRKAHAEMARAVANDRENEDRRGR